MEYFAAFMLFLAKVIVIFGGFGLLIAIVFSASSKGSKSDQGHLKVSSLNDHYDDLKNNIKRALLSHDEYKKEEKKIQKALKISNKENKIQSKKDDQITRKPCVFVLDFMGDIRASTVKSLREEVTAILSFVNTQQDEVLVRLESVGGMVPGYGLAASQLKRIVDRGVRLTVAVDKVAASGGYMMACVAPHIVAAPFAVLGSIGVVAQLPNINKLLKKHHVDVEMHTAGEYKRTLTMFGENTEKGRKKFKEDIEDIHKLFKDFVRESRSVLDIEKVSTGEIWYGKTALAMGLIDELKTSDEYLYDKIEKCQLVQVTYEQKKSFMEKLGGVVGTTIEHTVFRCLGYLEQRFFS